MVARIRRGFRSRRFGVRAAWLGGTLAVGVGVVVLAGVLSHLPNGYDKAQSKNADWLNRHGHLPTLKAATLRDIFVFVPIYLLFGLAVIHLARPARPGRGPGGRWWRRFSVPQWALLGALVGGGVADWAETGLFRMSLTRLIASSGTRDVTTLTTVTARFTFLKWTLLGLSLVLLSVNVLGGLPRDREIAGQ